MSKREITLTQLKVEGNKTPHLTGVKREENEMSLSLTAVKVEGGKNEKMPSRRETDFVYVNSAFVGSVHNVNDNRRDNRTSAVPSTPVTEVYREQYWACSRWPYTQRVLALTIGVVLGALIGLTISLLLRDSDDNSVIGPFFKSQRIAPD